MLHFTLVLLYFYRNFWRKKKKVSAYLLTQQNLNTTASIWPAKPTIKRSITIMLRTLYLSLCTVSRDGISGYLYILRYLNTWISRPFLLSKYPDKVHLFWEGHKILRNLHRRFDCYYIGQIYGGDFAKFCGLLRIYELYVQTYTVLKVS